MLKASPGPPNSRCLCLAASLFLISLCPEVSHANELKEVGLCTLVPTEWADGDSFLVKLPDGKQEVFRLYYVDCIERSVSDTSDKRRLREQARYFGVSDYLVAVGKRFAPI